MMTGSGPEPIDDANVFAVLAEVARVDGPTHDFVLDRLGGALTALFDVLSDEEAVRWLFPAALPAGPSGAPRAVLVVITDRRLILIDEPVTPAGVGQWPLEGLTAAVHHGGPYGSEQWLDVLVAGVRLALQVQRHEIAARAAGLLLGWRPGAGPSTTPAAGVVDELTKWANLWQMGALTDEEFARRKAELLGPG